MRATSSSSAISRLSRSASALTVCSISFFWSSLSLSQRLRSACTKPLTPVSGERSSWATVATRSERSRSSRARPRPDRSVTARPVTGPPGPARSTRAATSTSVPSGSSHDCSGMPVRVEQADVRGVAGAPVLAVLVLEPQHLADGTPEGGVRVDAQHPGRGGRDQGDPLVGVRRPRRRRAGRRRATGQQRPGPARRQRRRRTSRMGHDVVAGQRADRVSVIVGTPTRRYACALPPVDSRRPDSPP